MSTALVGTTDGLREIGGREQVWHSGREVTALARDNGTWWAILDGHNVWRAGSDMSWEEVASSDELRLNCILPTEDGPLVGTAESHVYRVAKNELRRVESFEATPGRDTWHTPWGGPPDVRSMVSSPSGDVFANVHVGGIPRSQDSGSSWSPTIEVNADVHQVGLILS